MLNEEVNSHHICVSCGRQFIDVYSPGKGYSDEIKLECLKAYVNREGFRAIERSKSVHHTTVIYWLKQIGEKLPDAPPTEEIPEVGELEVPRNFPRVKKNTHWLWTAVNHFRPGILAWVLGDDSAETFKPLWDIICCWRCYFYVTDGWKVYPSFIEPGDQIVSKTYMTRVEGENTRLRLNLARLQTLLTSLPLRYRKTLCYSKSVDMLKSSIRLLLHYLKYREILVIN